MDMTGKQNTLEHHRTIAETNTAMGPLLLCKPVGFSQPSLTSRFLCLVTTRNHPKIQSLTTIQLHSLNLFQGAIWLSQLSSCIQAALV